MFNENSTAGKEQVSQDRLEALFKLAHSGSSPDAISFALKIDIETVQQIIANDPKQTAREVQSIQKRSAKYRCAQSNRLMISPVMDHEENFYEESILEADPSFSRDRFIQSKKLKAKIADFSKESLKVLDGYLRQKDPQEDILKLTAECLSVVIHDAGLESALRVLGAVEGETLRKLTGKLRSLVPEEMFIGLMSQLARQLPSHALCLAAQIILEPRSERVLEEAFRCFAELLSQVTLDAGAIDLAEEVSVRLSRSQLSQMNAALGARPSEGGDRLDGLRLKEAYALLREGEVDAAICLVNTLHITPHLEKEVLRFFDEAGLSSGKVPILEQRLSAKLKEISRDSPSLGEALSILHQLHKAALQSHKPEAADQSLISLKTNVLNETVAEVGQHTSNSLIAQDTRIQRLEEQTLRMEADDQEALASLRAKVEALTEEFVKAGQAATQTQIAQDTRIKRLEEQTLRKEADDQETLSSLRGKAEALTEELEQKISQVKRAQDMKIQRLDERRSEAEATTHQALNILRRDFMTLSKNLDKTGNQCKEALQAMLKMLEEQFLKTEANALKLKRAETSLQDTRETLYEVTLPIFIYSYKCNTNQLHRTSLVTGEQSSHQVPSYIFKECCCWTEVPGGSLIITGGGLPVVSEVDRIDVGTFEVSPQRDMLTPRFYHAAVYHTQHLYALGGYDDSRRLSECERYVCAENRWEALPPLPQACSNTSGVVLESSLYALGGYNGSSSLDLVQKLSLESLTWEVMQFRLPIGHSFIPCFKLRDTEVYLVDNNTLCSFTGLEVRPVKTLTEGISSWYGASYYHRGTLYCSTAIGSVRSYEIGSLSN
jgi:hypothetical protein